MTKDELYKKYNESDIHKYDKEVCLNTLKDLLEEYTKIELDYDNIFDLIDSYEPNYYSISVLLDKKQMTSYISPMNKDYKVGRTVIINKDDVIFIYRPEKVKLGSLTEITRNKNSVFESVKYEFGTMEEGENLVIINSFERNKFGSKKNNIRIAVLLG